jgi:protein-disulfide isomerase
MSVRLIFVLLLLLAASSACRRETPSPPSPAPATQPDASGAPAAPQAPFSPFARVDADDPAALETPRQGAEQPLVVIVEAGSYACPATRRAEGALKALAEQNPRVARYFLHNPLPGQKEAWLLALAASAAQRQGRFWELHEKLLEADPAAVDEDQLLRLARSVDLDVPTFLKDLKRPELKAHVERNRTLVAALGLTGTPTFLVNGKVVLGWPKDELFAGLVKSEAEAAAKLADGPDVAQLHRALAEAHRPYAVVMEQGVRWNEAEPLKRRADEWTRYRVSLDGGDGGLGPEAAPVTVQAWLDPTCPHSARAWLQLHELLPDYGTEVRLQVKLNPSFRDPKSLEVADAAWAAGRVGRLVTFLDLWFTNGDLDAAVAAACGDLPDGCPREGVGTPAFQERLTRRRLEALSLPAIGTPTLFVNGLRRKGTLPDRELDALLLREEKAAGDLAGRGMPVGQVHDFLTSRGYSHAFLAPERLPLSTGDLMRLGGGEKADVDVVAFVDFRSPFCRNLWRHLLRFQADHEAQAAVWLAPLVTLRDEGSEKGAAAAVCAQRFGAAHLVAEALFQLDGESALETLTAGGGREPFGHPAFQECLADPATKRTVSSLRARAESLRIPGAPVVFMDGHRVVPPAGLDYYSLTAALRQALATR